ncbi:hypothetical protein ASD02_18895 [Ensifer sp. Root1252]|nr:hypothetical protein ASD02_18895 [Ensifer sp. Root1252]KRC78687.1 hypothetical protein ASE32_26865 [Ensifer sp. Root231]KRD02590.1 hypothetical protein ASE47_19955 [Ensifer sp. Root258]
MMRSAFTSFEPKKMAPVILNGGNAPCLRRSAGRLTIEQSRRGGMQMQCKDGVAEELERHGRLDRKWDCRLGTVLDEAIETVDCAWAILATEIRRLGYFAERPVRENETPYSYFNAIKWDALEMSDSIYWSLPNEEREKDDRDLEEFEVTYMLREDCSPRVKALAFLTVGKGLICSADDGFRECR